MAFEYPSSSPQERRDAVESVRKALHALKREISSSSEEDREGSPPGALEQLQRALQELGKTHEGVDSPAWKALQADIAGELDARDVAALRAALEDNPENNAVSLDLQALADEIAAVNAYAEQLPQPSMQDRIWAFFDRIQDPSTRAMVVQFVAGILERFPFLAFLTGSLRFRAAQEQMLSGEDADRTIADIFKDSPTLDAIQKRGVDTTKTVRELLRSPAVRDEWMKRYNTWLQRKTAAEGAAPPQPFTEMPPELLDVLVKAPAQSQATPQATTIGSDAPPPTS